MPWKPKGPDDFPSLGWQLLDWFTEYLPSPRDPAAPLLFTPRQALELVEWWRLDLNGRLVHRRGISRESKGVGKSPKEGAKCIAEFAGPVRFDGWDANGEPVGRPWGLKNDPRAWVQIGALSEDQTDNTWSVIHYFLTENDGKAADALGIDAGLTRCYLKDQPGAKMEPVTTSAGSREGQPITYGALDQSELLTASNGGLKMARTIRRNAAKMNGRSYETANSFRIGENSVAELTINDVRKGAPGIFAIEVEAPREVNGVAVDESAPPEILRAALAVAYRDCWWTDLDRLVADVKDPSTPWPDACQFFFNWNVIDGGGWKAISKVEWGARAGKASDLIDQGRAALQVAEGQTGAALAFAGWRSDEKLQIETVRDEPGTGWLLESCKKANADTGQPIWYDPKSSTAGVVADLTKGGVKFHPITPADLVAGWAAFQNDVLHGGLVHLGAAGLTEAVRLAEVRKSGSAYVLADSTPPALRSVVLACIAARAPAIKRATAIAIVL